MSVTSGSANGQVLDHYLHTQFEVIRLVHDNLDSIRAVATHLTPVEDLVDFQQEVAALYAKLGVLTTASELILSATTAGIELLTAADAAAQRLLLELKSAALMEAEYFATATGLAAAEAAIATLNTELDALLLVVATKASKAELQVLADEVALIYPRLDLMDLLLADHGSKLATVEGQVTGLVATNVTVDSRLTSIDQQIVGHGSAINGLTTQVVSNEDGAAITVGRVTELETELTNLKTGESAQTLAIQNLTSHTSIMDGDIVSQGQLITGLTSRLDGVEGESDATALAVQDLTTTVTQQGAQISATSEANTALASRVTDTETGLVSNASGLSSLTTEVTSLGDNLTIASEDIVALKAEISSPGNLAPNAGFEGDTHGWEIFNRGTGWATTQLDRNLDAGTSLPLSMSALSVTEAGQPSGLLGIKSDNLPTRGGQEYILSGYLGALNCTATLEWRLLDQLGQVIQFGSIGAASLPNTDINLWPRLWGAIPADNAARELQIQVWIQSVTAAGPKLWLLRPMLEEVSGLQDGPSSWVPGVTGLAKATASAVSTLTARIDQTDFNLVAEAGRIDALDLSVAGKAETSALNALTTRVETEEGKSTAQAGDITALDSRLLTAEGDVVAGANATNALTIRVETEEAKSTAQAGLITDLTTEVAGKATTSALNALTTRVETEEGKSTAQASDITNLAVALLTASEGVVESFENGLSDWTITAGTAEVSNPVSTTSAMGGKIARIGNNAGNDTLWAHHNKLIPYKADTLYRIRGRFRQFAGAGGLYFGLSAKDNDQSGYITSTNTETTTQGNSHYFVPNAVLVGPGTWYEYEFFVRGFAATSLATGDGSRANPWPLANLVRYITPMFIANYNNVAGNLDIDYVTIEEADALGETGANATATAALTARVNNTGNGKSIEVVASDLVALTTTVGGKASSSALTTLDSRVGATPAGYTSFAGKITALDTTIAGKASSSALNTLDSYVRNDVDGRVTASATDITNLTATVGGKAEASAVQSLAVSVGASSLDVVKTPNFQDGIGLWGPLTGGSARLATASHPSLTWALRFYTGSYHENEAPTPLAPGDKFRVRAWVNTAAGFLPAPGKFYVGMITYNAAGSAAFNYPVWDHNGLNYLTAADAGSGVWRQVQGTMTITDVDAVEGLPRIVVVDGGSAYITDIHIEKISNNESRMMASWNVTLDVNGYVSGLSSINNGSYAEFGVLADKFRVVKPGGGAAMTWENGNLWNKGSAYSVILGQNFGTSSDFLMWAGPNPGSVALANKSSAVMYLTNTGILYVKGTLLAGTIQNGGYTTVLATAVTFSTGAFGTNGGPIYVNASYSYHQLQRCSNLAGNYTAGSGTTQATLQLWQKIGTGAFQLVGSTTAVGTQTIMNLAPDASSWITWDITGAITFTDNVGGTQDRTYELRMSGRTIKGWTLSSGTSVKEVESQATGVTTQEG